MVIIPFIESIIDLDEAYILKQFGCEFKDQVSSELDPRSEAARIPYASHQRQACALEETALLNSVQSLSFLLDRLNSLDAVSNDESNQSCSAKRWNKFSEKCIQSIIMPYIQYCISIMPIPYTRTS